MSKTITQQQINERYDLIDAQEKADQIAANAIRILVKELSSLKAENEVLNAESNEMRRFLLDLGFDYRVWQCNIRKYHSHQAQNSECTR